MALESHSSQHVHRPSYQYELLVTAVDTRADLFIESMESFLANVKLKPSRIIVHVDKLVDDETSGTEIESWLQECKIPYYSFMEWPAVGLGRAMLWCFQQATLPLVMYTQEDYLTLREIPVERALKVLTAHNLNHVRFNHRTTMAAKHNNKGLGKERWEKVEVLCCNMDAYNGDWHQVKLCIADHWYTQMSLWRVERALKGLTAVNTGTKFETSNQFVAAFNTWMNSHYGDPLNRPGGPRKWNDQAMRHECLKTYIWGPVGEPPFIKHTGSERTTGPIKHV